MLPRSCPVVHLRMLKLLSASGKQSKEMLGGDGLHSQIYGKPCRNAAKDVASAARPAAGQIAAREPQTRQWAPMVSEVPLGWKPSKLRMIKSGDTRWVECCCNASVHHEVTRLSLQQICLRRLASGLREASQTGAQQDTIRIHFLASVEMLVAPWTRCRWTERRHLLCFLLEIWHII